MPSAPPRVRVSSVLAFAFVLAPMTAGAAFAAQADSRSPPASQPAPVAPDVINADRPGIADGSRVIAKGLLQIEAGFQRESRNESGTATRTSFVPTLVRVGLFNRVEARVETNAYTWMHTVASATANGASGWSPASVGFKYQMTNPSATGRPSFGTIVRIFPASGSQDFATHHATGDVRLAADIDISPRVSLNPNVGITRSEGSGGVLFTAALAALTLSYGPSTRVNLFVDLGYQSVVDRGGSAALIIDGGLGYIIGRNLQLDISLGGGALGPAPHPFVSFGISRRWTR